MEKKVQLLDIAVDIAATKAASDATIEYLKEENSKVIYFLNSETLLLLPKNDEWKHRLEESELILPGNASVDASIDEILGQKRDPFFFDGYFENVLDYAIENGLEFMVVAEDADKFRSIQENIHEKRPMLDLSGMFLTEAEESLEQVVNEINSVAPDILIIALEEKKQLELLEKYRIQINAGLMLFTGNILYHKAVLDSEVPEQIQKLKIDNLYKWFRKGKRIKTFFDNLAVKLRLKLHQRDKDSDDI